MVTNPEYERGRINGTTAATLEGIAAAVDDMRRRFDRLACVTHAAAIAENKTWIKIVGGIGGAIFIMVLGLLLKTAFG